jgi:aspartate/methionine/tyrosine aminotransferase
MYRASWNSRNGTCLLHDVAELDTPPPPYWSESLKSAVLAEDVHYQTDCGSPEARDTIARWYGRRYGVNLDAGCVCITNGVRSSLAAIARSSCNSGDDRLIDRLVV